jgi:hypothetical protein
MNHQKRFNSGVIVHLKIPGAFCEKFQCSEHGPESTSPSRLQLTRNHEPIEIENLMNSSNGLERYKLMNGGSLIVVSVEPVWSNVLLRRLLHGAGVINR